MRLFSAKQVASTLCLSGSFLMVETQRHQLARNRL